MDKSGWRAPLGQATWEKKSRRKTKRTAQECQECVCADITQSPTWSLKRLGDNRLTSNRTKMLFYQQTHHALRWKNDESVKTTTRTNLTENNKTDLFSVLYRVQAEKTSHKDLHGTTISIIQRHVIPFVYPQECMFFCNIPTWSDHSDKKYFSRVRRLT